MGKTSSPISFLIFMGMTVNETSPNYLGGKEEDRQDFIIPERLRAGEMASAWKQNGREGRARGGPRPLLSCSCF